ncbi:uncharacterized protein LOC125211526 isoform X1 [Salvia hispanica]|uniref:uncharacterized protein LOC125211526 isoform X1 n=1 Tax=Salvia hispanica TaxID=49212 RepID=UPI0020098756|nr:uncharacterized protein LOC125211526 isoform X1 [Salvia hispanica]XP_047967314.1 uncharacterized protein LOC125211526 isoform X1 [Salvia hispanica]
MISEQAAKRHLTQRIENLDGKIDEQIEISKLIRSEVTDAHADLSQISFDLNALHQIVSGLDGKLHSLEDKQEFANAGVMYLCGIVNGKRMPMPERIQDQFKLAGNSMQNLMGLRGIVESPENNLLTDGNAQDYSSDKLSKTITRTFSNKC